MRSRKVRQVVRRNQFAMPSKNGVGGDEGRHVSPYGASER